MASCSGEAARGRTFSSDVRLLASHRWVRQAEGFDDVVEAVAGAIDSIFETGGDVRCQKSKSQEKTWTHVQQLHLEGGQDAAHPHAAGAKFSSAALADVLAACTRIVDLCLGVSFCKQRSHPQRSDRSDECAQLAGALRGSTAIKSSRCGDADEAVGDGGGAQE